MAFGHFMMAVESCSFRSVPLVVGGGIFKPNTRAKSALSMRQRSPARPRVSIFYVG